MKYERLEVRLDEEHQHKLAELKAAYHTSVSEAVRRAIDEAYEKMMVQERLAIVKRISEANIEDVPDPEELHRQLAEAHDPGLP